MLDSVHQCQNPFRLYQAALLKMGGNTFSVIGRDFAAEPAEEGPAARTIMARAALNEAEKAMQRVGPQRRRRQWLKAEYRDKAAALFQTSSLPASMSWAEKHSGPSPTRLQATGRASIAAPAGGEQCFREMLRTAASADIGLGIG